MTETPSRVTLPKDPQEIVQRLKTRNDENTLVEKLYPIIANSAGRELVAPGIVIMFMLAIHDFMQNGYPPVIERVLILNIPSWIDALIDDKEVAETAKQWLNEAVDSTKKTKGGENVQTT